MSLLGAIAGVFRGVFVAAATGAAAFGLIVVFHPFDIATPAGPSTTATALHQRIDDARAALARSAAELAGQQAQPQAIATPISSDLDAQIAAATERRDLALRHAQAIRDALAAGTDLTALAEIRDSVVIGQLLAQRATLDAQIAEAGARFRPAHPAMRALTAQRRALDTQIKAEATGIATALEAEARIDDAQVKQSQSAPPPPTVTIDTPDTTLATTVAAQRAELDSLTEAYLDLSPAAAAQPAGLFAPANLLVVAIAFAAAIVFQFGLLLRRRRLRREADLALWQEVDPEIAAAPAPTATARTRASVVRAPVAPMRRAS